MKTKNLLLLLTFISCILAGCGNTSKKEENKEDPTQTVSLKTDLFNQLENSIKKMKEKKYIEVDDSIIEIHKLTNKLGIIEDSPDELTRDYIKSLNKLTSDIKNQANMQKTNKIYYEYERSQIKVLSSIQKQEPKSSENGNDSNNNSSENSSSESAEDSASSNSTSDVSTGEQKTIVIPEEELLDKYPELTLTKDDKMLADLAVSLLFYASEYLMNDKEVESNKASIIKLKYYMYKINSSSQINKFDVATKEIEQASKLWKDSSYELSEENSKTDILNIESIMQNINSAIKEQNSTTIDVQCEIAIESLDKLKLPS
jgi:outer membrane murein-binding lipoprotein Lpp